MIPRAALKALDDSTPQLNPLICNGLATVHMKNTEEFLDSVFHIVAKGFPPELKYVGCRRCNPIEEYAEISKLRNSKTVFDVARSDIYLMEYRFQFMDSPVFSRYVYLPFVGSAGTFFLSGSRFVISPVLADQVISVGLNSVFVRVLKARLTFNRAQHSFKADGRVVSVHIVWSKIYNKKANQQAPKATTKAKSTIVHYLLAKYGFSAMFETFTKIKPIVGGEEITHERYPQADWVICESAQIINRNYRMYSVPTTLRIAVRRSEYTPMVEKLVSGVFYVADHFPDRVVVSDMDKPGLWQLLLGHIIWSGHVGAPKLVLDIQAHIRSLDEYLDVMAARKLKDLGYECRDIYDLMFQIVNNFDAWSLTADDRVSTMYDKELSVLQFVCYDFITAINQLYFNIISAWKKDYVNSTEPARSFNQNKIDRLMGMNLRQGLVFRLTKESGTVSTTGTSGDNKALKVTSLLVPQTKSTKSDAGKGRPSLDDPTKRLHVSVAEVGGCWALPKSEPDGRARINPTLQINEYGLVLRDPKYVELLDSIQAKIRRT